MSLSRAKKENKGFARTTYLLVHQYFALGDEKSRRGNTNVSSIWHAVSFLSCFLRLVATIGSDQYGCPTELHTENDNARLTSILLFVREVKPDKIKKMFSPFKQDIAAIVSAEARRRSSNRHSLTDGELQRVRERGHLERANPKMICCMPLSLVCRVIYPAVSAKKSPSRVQGDVLRYDFNHMSNAQYLPRTAVEELPTMRLDAQVDPL